MHLQGRFDKGFTLIELISIVILLSILGVVALARLSNTDGFESRAFYFDTINALRYAQKLAISTGCNVQATITANSYALHQRQTDCTSGAYTLAVVSPANRQSSYSASAPAGSGISINPAAVFRFTPQSNVQGLANDTAFTVDGRQFTVYVDTGLIDAQ